MATTDNETVELFKKKAAPVSIKVVEVKGMKEAMEYALAVCEEKEACELLLPGCALPLSDKGAKQCARAEIKTLAAPNLDKRSYASFAKLGEEKGFTMLREGFREHLAGIDVAFTTVNMAIAETATCVMECESEDVRLATMICETHVVALKKSQIVNSSHDAQDYLQKVMESGVMYTAFISGASRTADIERVLTLGVHGPLEMHVALMEG